MTGRVVDFTSSSYLGLRHASDNLRPWAQLTTGVPAALTEPAAARALAAGLAGLIGTDAALLTPSTLHAFWDLFVVRADMAAQAGGRGIAVYMDAASYPISRWGVERAACRGIPCRSVPHHDPGSLRRMLSACAGRGLRPVLVADGLCPGCGRAAPVADYLETCRAFGGELVLDDTQPLGVLGVPYADVGYGLGGGGSLRHAQVNGHDIIVVSSLAKAFGVPVTVVGGSGRFVDGYRSRSQTRMHCSPPSLAHVTAGARALSVNRHAGERKRARLGRLVDRFRRKLGDAGLPVPAGRFPVQSLPVPREVDPGAVYRALLGYGVRAVLHRPQCLGAPAISFLITACHSAADIDAAVVALRRAMGRVEVLATIRE